MQFISFSVNEACTIFAVAKRIFAIPFPEYGTKKTNPSTVFPDSKFSFQQRLLLVITIHNKMLCTKRIRL